MALKEYLDAINVEIDKRLGVEHEAQERALNKLENALEKRFDSMNEFRGQLRDQQAQFFTRSELESRSQANNDKHEQAGKRMQRMEDRINMMDGRSAGAANMWAWIVSGITVLTGIVTILVVLHH